MKQGLRAERFILRRSWTSVILRIRVQRQGRAPR